MLVQFKVYENNKIVISSNIHPAMGLAVGRYLFELMKTRRESDSRIRNQFAVIEITKDNGLFVRKKFKPGRIFWAKKRYAGKIERFISLESRMDLVRESGPNPRLLL